MNIAIIGGGIAGLTAAIALQQQGVQQQGMSTKVYEASATPRATGKGIWLPSNALQVMAHLGLADTLYAKGINIDRIELRNQHNTLLQHLDLAGVRSRFGHGTLSIRRQDLHEHLQAALEPDSLVLGKRCQTLQEHAHGVTLTFEDSQQVSCDVAIVAEGVHSRLRAHLASEASWRYAGQRCFLGIAGVTLPDDLHNTVRELWGGKVRFGFSAVTPEQVYWFAPISMPQDAPIPRDINAFLQEAYQDFPEPVQQLLEHTPATDIITTELGDLPKVDTWHSRRVVLIGDAAHGMTPNLGQGGAQAIEDAYVLAQELANTSPQQALLNYTTRRQGKAQTISVRARRFGQLAHLEQPWSTVRDACLQLVPSRLNQPALNSIYRLDS